MIRTLITLVFISGALAGYTQQCDEAALEKIPGKWTKAEQGTISIPAKEVPKARIVLASLDKMFRADFPPFTGLNAFYATPFYKLADYGVHGAQYTYWVNILGYYCVNNKVLTNPDRQTNLRVKINDIDIVFSHDAMVGEWEEKEKDHFGWLDNFPDQKNGVIYMKATPDSAHLTAQPDRWLITYDGKLPYAYVTRKEYLQKLKDKLVKSIKKEADDIKANNPVRPKAVQEQEKAEMLKKLKDDAAKGLGGWTAQYLRNYKTDEQTQEELIRSVTEMYSEPLKQVEDYLKRPEKELQQTAIISRIEEFKGFVPEGAPGASILVKDNPGYYDTTLSKAAPQVIFVTLTTNGTQQKFITVYNELRKRLDLQQLKAMLGKEPASLIVQTKPESKPAAAAKKEAEKKTPEFDVYKKTATPGYTPTPVTAVKRESYRLPAVDPKAKAKALAMQLKDAAIPGYVTSLLTAIEQNMDAQQKKNTGLLFDQLKNNPLDLGDAGAAIYFKGAVTESLWCLAKAASLQPGNKYILSNLGAILNLADAPVWSLPLLRYLDTKVPRNTTILNNLGQSLFALGETNRSKAVLDSCIRIYAYHPQANATRAVIADQEGHTAESEHFIEQSLEGAYSDHLAQYAQRRNINPDYSKLLNRYHPTSAEYINPRKFMPPLQCTNVHEAADLEARWTEWRNMVTDVQEKIKAHMEASGGNYATEADKVLRTGNAAPFISLGPLCQKADKLYKGYMDQVAALQVEAQTFYDNNYRKAKGILDNEHEEKIKAINKKYAATLGEGNGETDAVCKETNDAHSFYLQALATLNDDFNARFAEPMRRIRIEMMYWSEFLPMNARMREGLYYENALYAVRPFQMESIFIQPCNERFRKPPKIKEEDLPDPFCAMSFRFKISVVKLTGDCSKFDLEVEVKGVVFNLEGDFINKKATIALGIGASVELEDYVPQLVSELIGVAGGGIGAKGQCFIEMDGKGISDAGIRGEAGVESILTDKGDLKIGGKFGVNSGVDITPSPAVKAIGKAITEAFGK